MGASGSLSENPAPPDAVVAFDVDRWGGTASRRPPLRVDSDEISDSEEP